MMIAKSETKSGMALLVRLNLYRTFTSVYGLLYLIIGMILPIVMSFVFSNSIGRQADVSGIPIIASLIPAILPLFVSVGSIGVAYLFSSDRSNGFYEYLIATRRIKIRDIFLSYAIISALIVSLLLGVDFAIIYIILKLKAPLLLPAFLKLFIVYALPVSYFISQISVLAMLTWSSLSKRYVGVNSPGGIGSVIGIIPSLIFLFVGVESGLFANDIDLVGGLFSIIVFAVFVVILVVVIKLMSNERMLA